MLPENRGSVVQILNVLEPMIAGQRRSGWSCSCGCTKVGPAQAVYIQPGGDSYAGQEMFPDEWTIRMCDLETGKRTYSCPLSEFVDPNFLDNLFTEHFGTHQARTAKRESEISQYQLRFQRSQRVEMRLVAGVAILDNADFTRFYIDWGRAQQCAREVVRLRDQEPNGWVEYGQPVYCAIIETMRQLIGMKMYRKGPDPVYPFESRHLMNMSKALELVSAEQCYSHLFLENLDRNQSDDGSVFTYGEIVFAKK